MVFQVIHDLGVVFDVLSCCYCYSSCFSYSVFGDPWCVAFQVRGKVLITWLLVRFTTACRLLIFYSMPLALAYSIFKVSTFFPLFLLFCCCFFAWWGVYSMVVLFSRLKVTPFLAVWRCLVFIFGSLVPAVLYWLRVLVVPLLPLFGCSYLCRGFFIWCLALWGPVWAPYVLFGHSG